MAITKCKKCDAYINTEYGEVEPSFYQNHEGTRKDPRAPGDYDTICDVCNYKE